MKSKISGFASTSFLIFMGIAALLTSLSLVPVKKTIDTKEVINNNQSLKKFSGTVITYVPDGNIKPTQNQMSNIKSILRSRLDAKNYLDASVTISKTNNIIVEIPNLKDPQDTVAELGQMALLELIDSQEQSIFPGQALNGGQVILAGSDIIGARAMPTQSGTWEIEFNITPSAQAKIAAATEKLALTKSPIAITLDRFVISAPLVQSRIDSNTLVITGQFTEEEAKNLATIISAGALPFKLKAIDVKYVN